jgi:hypothetical protein
VAEREQLHERIRVRQRRRLRRQHDERLRRRGREPEHARRHTGRDVDEQRVDLVVERVDLVEQRALLRDRERGQLGDAARGGHEAHALRPLDDDVVEPRFLAEHVQQAPRRAHAEHDVEIRQPEIRIE